MKANETYLLAETLFAGAFAHNPKQNLEELVSRCLEAAISYDERIDALKKVGLDTVKASKPEENKAASKEKRVARRKQSNRSSSR